MLDDCRPEAAETDVLLVAVDSVAESRELVVGVLVYVVDDADPRFGVKLARWLIDVCFFAFSGGGELCCCCCCSSIMLALAACPFTSESMEVSATPIPRPTPDRCEVVCSLSLSFPDMDP